MFLLVTFCIFVGEGDVITMFDGFGDVENGFPIVGVKKNACDFDGFVVCLDAEGAFGWGGGIEFAIKDKDDFIAVDFG